MKRLKTKISVLAVCTAFLLPSVVDAATTSDTKTPSTAATAAISVHYTLVKGISVPGYYVTNKDSRVAYIPGGVGLVVVDKATALPSAAYYLDK